MRTSLGELWLARGDPGTAIDYADTCLTAAEATASRRNIVKGRRLKGEALLAQGAIDAAEAEVETALFVAREVGNPVQLWKTLEALGRVRAAQARHGDAVERYREAVAVVDRIAAGLADSALRETLLGSTQVARLREALARAEVRL